MKRFIKIFGIFLLVVMIFGVALPVFAQSPSGSGSGGDTGTKPPSGSGASNIPQITNPLNNINDLGAFIKKAADIIRNLAIIVAVIFLIWAGFKFVTAQGNTTKLEEAKKMLWYTIVGIAVILGAWIFVNAIRSTVDTLKASENKYQVSLNPSSRWVGQVKIKNQV